MCKFPFRKQLTKNVTVLCLFLKDNRVVEKERSSTHSQTQSSHVRDKWENKAHGANRM